MHLIQILLPVYDQQGKRQAPRLFAEVRGELTERFGGLTAYTRAPAEGLWVNEENRLERDDVVIVEVMTETLDAGWWHGYRRELEARFGQKSLVVRAQEVSLL
jgi:hypothetical protein